MADVPPPAEKEPPVGQARDAYVTLLFNRYRHALHRYLSRLVATDEVPDLVQETYVRLLRHDNVIQIDALARGLLFQTATNLVRDFRRRRASRSASMHVPLEEGNAATDLAGPEERLSGEQMLTAVERAISRLPDETRAVFLLSRVRGLSYPAIAEALALSPRTVARKMAEALDALAEAVGANP